jgi:hypothetical protein
VKKIVVAVAFCCSLVCSPVQAKTFVGVLWPMFGPAPAVGLVELVAELKMMPDVEVSTYLHQSWPSLVQDIDRQPPGTRTVVVGYSLGANSSVFVANQAKHVDLIVALQPSMLSWNPPVTGNVGRMIEIYNPNPWMTFGGMGSKKLVGQNIEYIANNDSHPGAQFNFEFRQLVKSEIAKFNAAERQETLQAQNTKPQKVAQLPAPARPAPAIAATTRERKDVGTTGSAKTAEVTTRERKGAGVTGSMEIAQVTTRERKGMGVTGSVETAQVEAPRLPRQSASDHVAEEPHKQQGRELTAFLDELSGSVQSGSLFLERPLGVAGQRSLAIVDQRQLTAADMKDYAERKYRRIVTASE